MDNMHPATIVFFAILSACAPSVPEATDEQIVTLLGGPLTPYEVNLISEGTLECLDIISGQKDDVFQDAPKEYLGMIKTECREMLYERTNDETRNPLGFELEHFEDQGFAQRAKSIRQEQETQIETMRKEDEKNRPEREYGQTIIEDQELIENLHDARLEAIKYLEDVEIWVSEMRTICEFLYEIQSDEAVLPILLERKIQDICSDEMFTQELDWAKSHLEEVQNVLNTSEKQNLMNVPTIGNNYKFLNGIQNEVEDLLIEVKVYLENQGQKT